jgi:hypothetical protein
VLKWFAAVVLVAVAAFWIVRLAGGGNDHEAAITATIEEVATSDDASYCTRYTTQAYLEQVSGLPGDAAVTACVETAADEALVADRVEVSKIVVDGSAATAEVTYEGTAYDGSTIRVALVESGGEWLLDGRQGFVSIDREGLEAGLRETFASAPTSLSPRGAECAAERIASLDDAGIEAALLSSDTSAYTGAIIACDRESYLDGFDADLLAFRYPQSLVGCIRADLDRRSDVDLAAVLDDPVEYTLVGLDSDRDGVIEAYGDLIVAEGAEPEVGECASARLAELTDEEIAQTAVDAAALDRIYAECEGA